LLLLSVFRPSKEGKEEEFREWFVWSNNEFAKHPGFVGRRLLKPVGGGPYVAIVEHESMESFAAMNGSPFHAEAGKRVGPLLDGNPAPQFFEVMPL
jgi:heme-degrading monooxygenase HmoA